MRIIQAIKLYFVSTSILMHCLVFMLCVHVISEHLSDNWRWKSFKRWCQGSVDKSRVYTLDYKGFESLPTRLWIKIHQQSNKDKFNFESQIHAGCAFDYRRGRLLMFGSDTHAKNWDNSVHIFDMDSLEWQETYPLDSPETYTLDIKGFPVAGKKADHPWAMHTFGSVEYDAVHDSLIVASFPGHMKPDKYGKTLAHLWPLIKQHPTWNYHFSDLEWKAYEGKSFDFFPYSVAYDSNRGVVTGFRPNGIYEWYGEKIGWKQVGNKSYYAYHTNVVYDSVNKVFVMYGGNDMKNNVHVYAPGDESSEKMSTLGERPPAGQSIPLAFHKQLGKTIAVIDQGGVAQTWLYEFNTDYWERIEEADFPYNLGMNYCMEYDHKHNLVVLVSSPPFEKTAVWVLKL